MKKKMKKWFEDLDFSFSDIFFIAMACIGAVCMLIVTINYVNTEKNEPHTYTQTINIESVRVQSDSEGFIVGRTVMMGTGSTEGSLEAHEYYVVYQIQEDGGKTLVKLDAEKTIIYTVLKEGEPSYAEITFYKPYLVGDYEIEQIKLYVPTDAINEEYDLN